MRSNIIPGILEKEWNEIERKIEIARNFTNILHVDIIDGKFVDNRTFLDPDPFRKYSEDVFFELHMMVIDPIELIESWANAGFKRFIGQVEQMSSQRAFVEKAKQYGEAGLALDGPTHINAIKIPFEQLDSILVYTSNRVGFSGPPLMEERLDKVRHLKRLTNAPIEVDGGINDKTILMAKDAGATRFVSTSYIFSNSPRERFATLIKSTS
jgi:ribulose-phosphate 3-epimerase